MDRIVGIGEYIISDNQTDIIKTFALATCVAVTLYSASKRAAGMVHIALPYNNSDMNKNSRKGYYANSGVPLLVNSMCMKYGCLKNELVINLYGGARSIRNDDYFNIGIKNIEAVKKELDNLNLKYNALETGGTCSRTLEMQVDTGLVKIIKQPLKI